MKLTLRNIEKLLLLVKKLGFDLLEIQEGNKKIKLRKNPSPPRQVVGTSIVPTPQTQTNPPPPSPSDTKDPNEIVEDEKHVITRSPLVGTFYRAQSPTATPFVEIGDMVKKGQVLCVVEAMKLMNEVEAEVNGKITSIFVENQQPVEYGQPLFLIEV